MARWEFKLPDIGEGVTEGEIVTWRVSPGDRVEEDQPVVEIMTDKATVTITAPRSGTVVETRGRMGEIVPVHDVLVVFDLDGGSAPVAGPADTRPPPAPAANGARSASCEELEGRVASPIAAGPPVLSEGGQDPPRMARVSAPGAARSRSYFNDKPLATPATRKMARDQNVDLRQVPPSGPQGRVTLMDVEEFARERGNGGDAQGAEPTPLAPELARATRRGAADAAAERARVAEADAGDERVPVVGLRRRIVQKMAHAKRTAAHFTFVEECDASALKSIRERLKPDAAAIGIKLSLLPFIVKAVVASLRKHPSLNATLDEGANEIVLKKSYNIGIATATDGGLVVPVVKSADRKSIVGLATDIERLAADARAGKTRLEDLQGATFTITSLGVKSGLLATPIINVPEVAILGVHQIKEKPVVRAGQIVIGEVMLLSLSFDHRVVDGHVGAAFAYEVIGYLERPERLLLEMV